MGTPVTRPTTPLPSLLSCDWCLKTTDQHEPKCQHCLCAECSDTYCPLCLQQHAPIRQEYYTFNAFHEKRRLVGTFFELSLEFIFGYLYEITVLSSDRNCRLQCCWAEEKFDLCLYRRRRPYNVLPQLLSNAPGLLFSASVVPPTLDAPKLVTTPCSWRLLVEMFHFCLDRPEVARLDLLPDTATDFLELCCHSPQQLYQLWQFQHPFPKYKLMFFATSEKGLSCLQCGQVYSTVDDMKQCLGGPLVQTSALMEAVPILLKIEHKTLLKTLATTPFPTFRDFWRQWPNASFPRKSQLGALSFLYTIHIQQQVTRPNLALYIDNLFDRRVPKFICFDFVFADQYITSTCCWICQPLSSLPPSATFLLGLEKFMSLCYLSLHQNALRHGALYTTPHATYSLWRDLCARSTNK